ncbi:MAG: DUF4315 family protein [Firmicutes bacterium]|nr:DUF4315 family protein [Bacillota bacterium]
MAGFFDKVVVGLNKGVNTVSEGSKFIVEKANLNTQIKDIEKEKNKLLQNMGILVYNLQASGEISIEQCAGICSEVEARDRKIIELQERLKELEAAKTQTVQYTQTVVPTEVNTNGITCKCGFVNKEGAKFCAGCGQPLTEQSE